MNVNQLFQQMNNLQNNNHNHNEQNIINYRCLVSNSV